MNLVEISGRLVRDPDLRFSPSGLAMTRMTLAVDKNLYGDKKKQAIEQGKPTADFISIIVFGKKAESTANYLAKGKQCIVTGKISTGSYVDKNGEKKYTTDVIADNVEFIGGRDEQAPKKSADNGFFDGVKEDDKDVFQTVDSQNEIPF